MTVDILPWLRLFDPVTEGDGILCFFAESPETFPARQSLLEAAMNWVRTAGEDRVGFYTVEEELAAARAPPKVSSPARNKLAKKVTNAVLAEQVAAIVETLPAVFEQLFTLQASQEAGSMMSSSNMRPKVLRYRQRLLCLLEHPCRRHPSFFKPRPSTKS